MIVTIKEEYRNVYEKQFLNSVIEIDEKEYSEGKSRFVTIISGRWKNCSIPRHEMMPMDLFKNDIDKILTI
jgi:hypothetical protein